MTHSKPDYFADLEAIVTIALSEDIGDGDITAQLIPENQTANAVVITREPAIVCGRPWFDEVFRQLDANIAIEWLVEVARWFQPRPLLFYLVQAVSRFQR